MEPLDRSTIWPYDEAEPGRFFYQRYGSPTVAAAEAALGELEGGTALLFPSGAGATTALMLALLEPGQTVALTSHAYYGTAVTLELLGRWGLQYVEFDQTGPPPDGVDLILVEAPANPLLTMPDLDAAVAHPAPVVCDATVSSPLRLRPLEHGCDVALHSATKILSGHDDVLAGVTVTRDEELRDRLHQTRRLAGIVASADTAWLVRRGLETLAARLDRQEAGARALAERLAAHEAVETVRYPGFSFLVTFDVADGEAAGRVERAVRTIVNATSLGGTRSKLEARHRWEGDRIPSGLLRLSVGLEDPDELWADLEQALASA